MTRDLHPNPKGYTKKPIRRRKAKPAEPTFTCEGYEQFCENQEHAAERAKGGER